MKKALIPKINKMIENYKKEIIDLLELEKRHDLVSDLLEKGVVVDNNGEPLGELLYRIVDEIEIKKLVVEDVYRSSYKDILKVAAEEVRNHFLINLGYIRALELINKSVDYVNNQAFKVLKDERESLKNKDIINYEICRGELQCLKDSLETRKKYNICKEIERLENKIVTDSNINVESDIRRHCLVR